MGPQGLAGPAGKDGATGPAGRDGTNGIDGAAGPAGKDGAAGPQGPAGPPGSGGSLATIQSLAGLPCTVAMCPGTTTFAFDPLTSAAQLTCVRFPGGNTLRIQGTQAVGTKLLFRGSIAFTSDVQGFGGPIEVTGGGKLPQPFDIPVGGLCTGQVVTVTVTLLGSSDPPLVLQGGSCAGAQFPAPSPGIETSRVMCVFTMDGNQALTIQ